MAEIDLVPGPYRRLLAVERLLRRFGIALALAIGAVVLLRAGLAWSVSGMQAEIDRIDAARILAQSRHETLEALRQQWVQAERNARILSGLRGGVAARDMFRVLERASGGTLWFLDWNFRRAGEIVDFEPRAVQTGYFLIVPLEEPSGESKKAWRLETHMEIRGRAIDHSTLAGFVRRLIEQPEIESARVLRTSTRSYTDREVVDFELAVVVRSSA